MIHTHEVILVLSIWAMIKHVLLLEKGISRFGCMIVLFGLCVMPDVPEVKTSMISLETLHVNSFGYKTEEDCIKVSKGTLIVMKGKMSAGSIYKLMGNTIVDGVVVVKSDQDNYYKEVQALFGLD